MHAVDGHPRSWHVVLASVIILLAPSCRKKAESVGTTGGRKMICADDIYTNGRVVTVGESTGTAGAFSVKDGRFLAVGAMDTVMEARCKNTVVHDLGGRVVLPGLVDSHAHMLGLGLKDTMLVLDGLSAEDVVARVASAEPAQGQWIQGRGWDQTLWPGKEFPDRALLDGASPGVPVFLKRVDGHAAWVNSAALEAAGIGRETPDPEGGRILRRNGGEPTGVLVDNAIDLVTAVIPPPTRQVKKQALRSAVRKCLGVGLTMVHDAGVDAETVDIYRELVEEGEFPFRLYGMVEWQSPGTDALLEEGPVVAWKDALWLRAVKFYSDGALGSRGAALLEPYADEPSSSGLLVTDEDELREAIGRAVALGFQTAVHAIGDRANRIVIDIYSELALSNPGRDLRLRIEHAQVLALADIPRLGRSGIVASMQPAHATSDMRWAGERLGKERLAGAYAWRKVLSSGALLAYGSDFPVESHNPFFGIHASVTRMDRQNSPGEGWLPGERLTLDEALRSFTIAGARASFAEDLLGSIEPGKLADFVVLEDDLLAVPADRIHEVRVRMTAVGGKIAFGRL